MHGHVVGKRNTVFCTVGDLLTGYCIYYCTLCDLQRWFSVVTWHTVQPCSTALHHSPVHLCLLSSVGFCVLLSSHDTDLINIHKFHKQIVLSRVSCKIESFDRNERLKAQLGNHDRVLII